MNCRISNQRGVSLIEALVALAVMAFGMLGVAAMQATLRQNADLARQRGEATRLAQATIEALRAYTVVDSVAGRRAYADVTTALPDENIVGTNATFVRSVNVTAEDALKRKTVDVRVTWTDRTSASHVVRLSSVIYRTPPELAAALIIPGEGTVAQFVGTSGPGGSSTPRNPTIPQSAVNNPNGTSTFTPPQTGVPTVTWIFDNTTGMITQRCAPACDAGNFGRLLSGYIVFSTGSNQPAPAQAEAPSSNAMPVGISITNQTLPNPLAAPSPAWECFVESLPAAPATAKVRAYYCLIRVLSADNFRWSARSQVTGLSLAGSINDDDDDEFRVCRYTPYRNNNAVGTGSPPIRNVDHPYNYLAVDTNLVNQNFLVIRAGDDDDAFDCPVDHVPGAPLPNLVNTNTWHHQPSS